MRIFAFNSFFANKQKKRNIQQGQEVYVVKKSKIKKNL